MIIKNIETKIRLATFIAVASLTVALLMVVAVSFFAYKQVGNARRSVYILDANNIPMSARQTDVDTNRPIE